MTTIEAQFEAIRPAVWRGRFARIPGDCTVFHLHHVGGRLWPVILWEVDGRATCKAVECDAAGSLAESVERAKRVEGGTGAGSFLINEFGQVLVPASNGSGRRYVAGHLTGRLLFQNPFCQEEPIDLGEDNYLQPGDPWKLPYIGVPYNLSRDGKLYFYKEDENGGRMTFPPRQDESLIRTIQRVRSRSGVRFIVNYAGLVLTKCERPGRFSSTEPWQAVYVGSINPNLWFEKE